MSQWTSPNPSSASGDDRLAGAALPADGVAAPGAYLAPVVMYAPPAPRMNTLAIISFVLIFMPTGPLSIPFAHIALNQIKRTGEGGRVFAILGLVFGYLWAAMILLWLVLFVWLAGLIGAAANSYGY